MSEQTDGSDPISHGAPRLDDGLDVAGGPKQQKFRLRRWLPWVVPTVVLGGILAVAVPRIAAMHEQTAAIGGPFALTDQQGHTVTDTDFRGKVMMVYFGYTFCPDVCPTTLGTIGTALDQLSPGERKQVASIFITVDPERDTPKILADYVANFAPDLVGLSGSAGAVQKMEREHHVYTKKHPEADGSYSMDHSSIIYLMDRDGRFRSILSGEVTATQVADGLRKIL